MLSGDGLLLVLILTACAMVVLGTLELRWPTRPRHPRRRPAPVPDVRARVVPRAVTIVPKVLSSDPTPADTVVVSRDLAAPKPPEEEPVLPPPAPVEPTLVEPAGPLEAEGVAIGPSEGSVFDRGLALVKARRLEEAASLARHALAAMKLAAASVPTPGEAQETARLWGLVGLAQQGLDEVDEARFAFEEAIAHAPAGERPTWERHLATLALEVGRRPLVAPAAAPSAERIASLQSAIEWLHRGLTAAPDDAELGQAVRSAHEALWAAHESVATDLVQRKEFGEARRLLDGVIADPECPAARRGGLVALLGRALSGEARLAISDALRHRLGGRAEEATAALTRAEQVLTPLFRAWSLARAAGEPEASTRELLVRVLDEIVDARADDVDALIDGGDPSVAAIHADKLWTLVRGAADQGLSPDDLGYASNRALALFDRMQAPRPAPRPDA